MSQPGVFINKKSDGTVYYRAAITYKGKRISLGSYDTEDAAHEAYLFAGSVLAGFFDPSASVTPEDYDSLEEAHAVPFSKFVMLLNLSRTGMYCRNAILLRDRYFLYYLSPHHALKFDADDLFYYMNHAVMQRGGHYFVADYGSQLSILSRYGIRSYAVPGRDYEFVNGDPTDFRYSNLRILNRYHGVTACTEKGQTKWLAHIHVKGESALRMNGDIVIGRYDTEPEAAAAYNKASGFLKNLGLDENRPLNYIDDMTDSEYAILERRVNIDKFIRKVKKRMSQP